MEAVIIKGNKIIKEKYTKTETVKNEEVEQIREVLVDTDNRIGDIVYASIFAILSSDIYDKSYMTEPKLLDLGYHIRNSIEGILAKNPILSIQDMVTVAKEDYGINLEEIVKANKD